MAILAGRSNGSIMIPDSHGGKVGQRFLLHGVLFQRNRRLPLMRRFHESPILWLSIVAYVVSFACPAIRLPDFRATAWGWEVFLYPLQFAFCRGDVFILIGWLPNLLMWAAFLLAWQGNDALPKRMGGYAFVISLAFWEGWLHRMGARFAGYYLWTLSMLLMAIFAILRERRSADFQTRSATGSKR